MNGLAYLMVRDEEEEVQFVDAEAKGFIYL